TVHAGAPAAPWAPAGRGASPVTAGPVRVTVGTSAIGRSLLVGVRVGVVVGLEGGDLGPLLGLGPQAVDVLGVQRLDAVLERLDAEHELPVEAGEERQQAP